MVNIQHFHWIYKCSSVAEYHINCLCTELSSLLCIQSSWWYIKGMINGHQGKMLNMLYMYILIYWWNRLIFRAAINWFSNHSRKTTLFISWWWSPSFDLARNTKSQPSIKPSLRIPVQWFWLTHVSSMYTISYPASLKDLIFLR